ncbi:hypothetical protein PG995_006494 [Apiospora arundinis]
MHEQAKEVGIPYPEGSQSWYSFKIGVYYAHVCYPRHPLEVRIYTGIYTWLAVLVDDGAKKDPREWSGFVARFPSIPQPSPVAQAWASYIQRSYEYYDHWAASFIVTSSLNFVNASALANAELPHYVPTVGAKSWPYYLRDKDGLSEAYALLTFPRALYPHIACYMEALPDMIMYISFVNDIMSFYKEEIADEKSNYMHNRAFAENTDVHSVFKAVVSETIAAHRRIVLVLGGDGKEKYAQAWLDHANGSVAMHRSMDRYRLREIGLGGNYIDDHGLMDSNRE